MKNIYKLSIFVVMVILFVMQTSVVLVQAQEKEIPIIIEGADAAVTDDGSRLVEVVKKSETLSTSVAAAEKKMESARQVSKGTSVSKLVRTFRKYRSDSNIDSIYYDSSNTNFDKQKSEQLRKDLRKWKEMRIQAKGMKQSDDPNFEKTYKKIREFEGEIISGYAPKPLSAPASTEIIATTDIDEKTDSVVEETTDELVAETETGRRLLEQLKARSEGTVTTAADNVDDDLAREKATADARMTNIRNEREKGVRAPANIRWSPGRVTFNKLQPGQKAHFVFTLINRSKHPFEGAIVPIEDWISVNPPTVWLEARSELDIDVIVVAPDRKKARMEGSVEIRSVGDSSKRVPVVLRTVNR